MSENRAELHLHTKLSDDISVIDVNEVIEKTEELGISAVAFTNFNNLQDFPKIEKLASKSNLKIIYGVEVAYEDDAKHLQKLTLLCKNQDGVKALYRVISSMVGENGSGLIDLEVLKQNRKNLLVGSCGYGGELFNKFNLKKSQAEIEKLAAFYDYFEIFPVRDDCEKEINKKIVALGEELGVKVIASSNPHYLEEKDAVCREVIMTAKGFALEEDRNLKLFNSDEMLDEFSYLGEENAKAVVIDNPKKIADLIEDAKPLACGYFGIKYENDTDDLENLCCYALSQKYGVFANEEVFERLGYELTLIEKNGFSSEYLTAYKIAKFVADKGHLVGNRGTAGSSFVAFLLGITDINPLPAHYYCPNCNYFEKTDIADNGLDLPDKTCPNCGLPLNTDGHNIPYESFMGFKGDKMPDFDLNVSPEVRDSVLEYLLENFGKDKVAMAGVIPTYLEYQTQGAIAIYENKLGVKLSKDDKQRITEKVKGVKRGSGVHPAGFMIIPADKEFEDFTPLNNNWAPIPSTHFEFHDLHDTILKFDIIGVVMLEMLEKLSAKTGVSISDINIKKPEIYSFFENGDTTGIFEFENKFMRDILKNLKPKTFNELVKISSLAHGTNVWIDNGEYLVEAGIPFGLLPTSREDIMNDLISVGADKALAFKMAEATRKGMLSRGRVSEEDILKFKEAAKPLGDWYFEFCSKVLYMFPKAHAIAYVKYSLIAAWFKKYYPKEFYNTYIECYFGNKENLTEDEREKYNRALEESQKYNN